MRKTIFTFLLILSFIITGCQMPTGGAADEQITVEKTVKTKAPVALEAWAGLVRDAKDSYEEDDSSSAAVTIAGGETQNHNFYDDAQDWIKVTAEAGKTYTFESVVTGSADTVFYLYNAGLTQLATNDDGGIGYASKIVHTAQSAGTLYLKMYSYGGNTGNNRAYTVKLTITGSSQPQLKYLTASESYTLVQANAGNSNFVILDVRTASEYATSHLANSVNIDYYAQDFTAQVNQLDKSKIYLVYCRSGNRSRYAGEIMINNNFTDVTSMNGGITDWIANGYPVVQ